MTVPNLSDFDQRLFDFIHTAPEEWDSELLVLNLCSTFNLTADDARKHVQRVEDLIVQHQQDLKGKMTSLHVIRSLFDDVHLLKSNTGEYLKLLEQATWWHHFYPRRYEGVGTHDSPKQFGIIGAWTAIGATRTKGVSNEGQTLFPSYCSVVQMVELKVPTYFVSRDLFRAMIETELPNDFTLDSLHWPLQSMLFMLPKPSANVAGFTMKGEEGSYFTALVISRIEGLKRYQMPFAFFDTRDQTVISLPVSLPETNLVITGLTNTGGVYECVVPIKSTPLDVSESAITMVDLADKGEDGKSTGFAMGRHTTPADQADTARLTFLAMQILLIMNARPEYVDDPNGVGMATRTESFKKGKKREALWSPNFFGRHYQIRRRSEGSEEPGSSKRTHWRRGHYRNQRYGVGNALVKPLWIEPMLINAPH